MDVADLLLFKQPTQAHLPLLVRVLGLDPLRLRVQRLIEAAVASDNDSASDVRDTVVREGSSLARLLLKGSLALSLVNRGLLLLELLMLSKPIALLLLSGSSLELCNTLLLLLL